MTIAKEELKKLAERGFTLSKSPREQDRLRGYYAICFVAGSAKADQYIELVNYEMVDLVQKAEQQILNSIND